MEAIEFKTKPTKDGTIKIPEEHLKSLTDECRVIILLQKKAIEKKTKKKKLEPSFRVKTKGFKFDREEAHER